MSSGVQRWNGGQPDRVPSRLWNDSQPCCFMLSSEGLSTFLHLIAGPYLVSTKAYLVTGSAPYVSRQGKKKGWYGKARQGMVGDVTPFRFGSACCIEDFLVGLFFSPEEGEGGRGPNQGAAFLHFVSFHVIGCKGREGNFGRKALLSEN